MKVIDVRRSVGVTRMNLVPRYYALGDKSEVLKCGVCAAHVFDGVWSIAAGYRETYMWWSASWLGARRFSLRVSSELLCFGVFRERGFNDVQYNNRTYHQQFRQRIISLR